VQASPGHAVGALRAPSTVLLADGAVGARRRQTAERAARVLVCPDSYLAAASQGARATASLRAAGLEVEVLDAAQPELPRANVEAAIAQARRIRPDCVVGLGGGSCIDLAKLVALGLAHDGPLETFYGENLVPGPVLDVVAVPTTAGTGSEVTPVAVLSDPERELKVGISSPALIPRVAICDPQLTLGAPASVTAYAGIDALAHAIEAYCARRYEGATALDGRVFTGGNVLTDGYALQAVACLAHGLRDALADDPSGRAAAMQGSLAAGLAFGTAGTAGAHALQYPLGAQTGTPHGLGVGVLLPFVMAHVAPACAGRLAEIGRAMGVEGTAAAAVHAVRTLASDLGLPPSLEAIGVDRSELGPMAAQAVGVERLMRNSPRVIETPDAERILLAAWQGDLAALAGDQDLSHEPAMPSTALP
jgi:alcohol dehydrogenase